MQAQEPVLAQPFELTQAEKTGLHDGSSHTESRSDREERPIEASPGVLRIIAIRENMTKSLRWLLFLGAFLIAYTYGIDGNVRGTMQPYATASYSQHSLLATINVVRGIVGATIQLPLAKIADRFGRLEVVLISIVFYTVGTIVEATSDNVGHFCAGAVLYEIGYTAIILLVEIIIGDTTSLQYRILASYIPGLPFLINAWVGGDASQAVLMGTTWQWGIGMWAIIYPVCAIPLVFGLWYSQFRAKRSGKLAGLASPYSQKGFWTAIFWELDVVGLVLFAAMLALILLPFTLAGGFATTWKTAKIIVMLVIGICLIPCFVIWEKKYAKSPVIPGKALADRTVLGCVGIAIGLNTAWYLQGDYLYTVLVVAFDQSIKSASRISSLYSFTSILSGLALGLVVRFVKRVKPFMIFGVLCFILAFGILIRYRGASVTDYAGIVGGQVVLGFAGGLFPYPAQALIQSTVRHEYLAVMTALYLSAYRVGSALGNTISGAIWTQVLPSQLAQRFDNQTFAAEIYGDPFTFAAAYPVGTVERGLVQEAYAYAQRILCITGICLCIPILICSIIVRNNYFGDTHNAVEGDDEIVKDHKVDNKQGAGNWIREKLRK